MEKIWKPVVGYEDYFSISSEGDVYSHRTDRILKQTIHKNGYYLLSTYLNGRKSKSVCFRVHRLVAQAFIPNPENKPHVNHLDGNKLNNAVDNLEWCTPQENVRHAYDTGLISTPLKGVDNPLCKLTTEDLEYIKKVYKPHCRKYGSRALARKFSISHSQILRHIEYNL